MNELRGDALKIKADLLAQREQERADKEKAGTRKFAQPKGRAGRFSAAHMAEFKKMDSIENHASAFRTRPGKFTPFAKGVKRSQSRANLDDRPEPAQPKDTWPASSLKKINPPFSQEPRSTQKRSNLMLDAEPVSAAKRAKQHMDDDASSSRPVSRDASFLPRPTTAGKDSSGIPRSITMASVMTPTKSSIARMAAGKGTPAVSLIKSPSKTTLGGLTKSVTASNIHTHKPGDAAASVTSPGRFDKVKSILLGGDKTASLRGKSALPLPAMPTSKTPGPPRLDKPLPRIPMTSPRRKLQKRSVFTPDAKRVALLQNSPSPVKPSILFSKQKDDSGDIHYPTLDTILADSKEKDPVEYPDLSALRPPPRPSFPAQATAAPPSVPGTFTFRVDHTIRFGSTSPTGFGSSPGQSSLRQVRPSIVPTRAMPGSFPTFGASSSSDKENDMPAPPPLTGIAHGIKNKKRHRISEDEEEAERQAEERAAKKRKNDPAPEGDALLAPRLVGSQLPRPGFRSPKKPSELVGFGASRTPSPTKKKPVLSLSRLNMLSRPKLRK